MIKLFTSVLMILLQFSCAMPLAQEKPKQSTAPNSIADKIKGVLQDGWNLSQSDNKIYVIRQNPVSLYNSISLPAGDEDLRNEMIERSKRAEEYKITLEFGERLSGEKYRELEKINNKTDLELSDLEDRMGNLRSKGNYEPKTPKDKALYAEYKQALSNLPYTRLPDLYDSQQSIYIEISHLKGAFYYSREESECRAVLGNIYSFADSYQEKIFPAGYASVSDYLVSTTFNHAREYDNYSRKKELNLR